MTNNEAIKWLDNLIIDVEQLQNYSLWHYEQPLTEIKELLKQKKKGKWIEFEDNPTIRCECSICGHKYNLYEDDIYGYPYCAQCGAEMTIEEQKEWIFKFQQTKDEVEIQWKDGTIEKHRIRGAECQI